MTANPSSRGTTLLYGPSYSGLRRAAIGRADDTAADTPASVLWLERNSHLQETVAETWAADHAPLRLRVSGLNDVANEAYDRLTGPRERLDALTRRRIVDRALRELDDANILDDAHRYRDEVLSLFSTLEAAGYNSPDALDDLLSRSAPPSHADTVLTEAYRRYRNHLDEVLTDEEYPGFEAYLSLREADLNALFPEVDVVVLSGYHELTLNERRFATQIAEAFPVVVTLPWLEVPDETAGANAAAEDAMAFYRDLATETVRIGTAHSLATVAGHLYTPTTLSDDIDPGKRLRWVEAQTPDREIRQVAASIKHRVATEDGFTQDDALVVVPGLISYREHVEDVFDSHDLTPVTYVNKLLYQTNTGRAMLDLVALCTDETAGASTVASLATNPAVDVGLDAARTTELARALPTDDISRLREKLDPSDRDALDAFRTTLSAVRSARGPAVVDALRDAFENVGLDAETSPFDDAPRFDAMMERRARRRVERALDAIERVARTADEEDVLAIVADELDQIRVPPPSQSAAGVLEVAGPREALGQEYRDLYLVGLTDMNFPPDPERPVFFEEIWDGLADVEPTDHTSVARYQFATMLASARSVYITTPRTTIDDDPLLESSVLDELRRVTGIDPEEDDLGNADAEAAQRAISRSTVDASDAVDQLTETGVFDAMTALRARNGVACAQHRASPERTRHDGLLDPETVDALYPQDYREPYSPSQLTAYAKCGFRFLADRVLGVDEPPEYKLEPDPLDFGTVAHDTLEYFYTGLQDGPGDVVDLGSYDRDELEERLLSAGERALTEADLPYDDAFYSRWLESLFAGLCDDDRNPYFGGIDRIHAPERGLFAKFLDAERERGADEAPGWFEVQLDLSDSDDRAIEIDVGNGDTVHLGGRIDRVAVDHGDDPPQGLVTDYKTGGGNSRGAVDGVSFQLPIYALAAGRELGTDGVDTPFDAEFYTLNHDDFGTGWSLSYYLYREGDHDDSDEAYRRLIEEETPRRIRDIAEGIEQGMFEPTVLDEQTAGCRHCAFSDVCDVRYHARRDVIASIDDADEPGYVPQYARADSYLDATTGDAE